MVRSTPPHLQELPVRRVPHSDEGAFLTGCRESLPLEGEGQAAEGVIMCVDESA